MADFFAWQTEKAKTKNNHFSSFSLFFCTLTSQVKMSKIKMQQKNAVFIQKICRINKKASKMLQIHQKRAFIVNLFCFLNNIS